MVSLINLSFKLSDMNLGSAWLHYVMSKPSGISKSLMNSIHP